MMNLTKEEKAKKLRYKKAMLAQLNLTYINDSLYDISCVCSDYQYFFEGNDETLLNALDGDEEQEYEFKMMFSDLSTECDILRENLDDLYVTEHFDDFFVGIMLNGGNAFNVLGYDTYQEDYYNLMSFESDLAKNESAKRLKRLTKDELLKVCGQCFGIATSFFNIQYKYDYLKAAFDILKDENIGYMQFINDIDEAYNNADKDNWYWNSENVKAFQRLINGIDEYSKMWIE